MYMPAHSRKKRKQPSLQGDIISSGLEVLGNPMKYYGRCANRLTVVGGANSRFDPSKTMDKIMFGDSDVAELMDDSTCDSERRWFHEF